MAIYVCMRAWRDMFAIASEDAEYQHIFLVPAVAAFLIWVRRKRFRHLRVSTTSLGTVLVIAGWAFTSWGFNHRTQLLFHGGAVLVLIGAIVAVLGKQALFRFLPVAVVLFMMVPLPSSVRHAIADPLQKMTAEVANFLLGLMGVETQVASNLLIINGRPVQIAEACNGMRMIFPLSLIAFGFTFGLPLRTNVRLFIVLVSPVVALICNVARVLPLIWLQGQGPSGQDWGLWLHDRSGWFMVPLAFFALLGLLSLLRWATVPIFRFPLASQG